MMLAGTALARMAALPVEDFDRHFGAADCLILAPHPDDESLGCGGLIAQACQRGRPPTVAILTDGTGSHPNSTSHKPPELRALREAETKQAMRELGLPAGRLIFCGYPDTAAPSEGQPLERAAAAIAELLRRTGSGTILTTWQHDPHGDHLAAFRIAQAASRLASAKLWAFPVWGWTLPPQTSLPVDSITGFCLDITAWLPAKKAAILAHRSQYAGIIEDDPEGFQMHPDFIKKFLGPTETFIEVPTAT